MGVMTPVVVKTALMLPTTEVTVGRLDGVPLGLMLWPGRRAVRAPLGIRPDGPPAVDGTKTMTPVNGVPRVLPAESVGVIRPVVVKALVPEIEVTVGRFDALRPGAEAVGAPLGRISEAPGTVDGTNTMTPEKGVPTLPAESVGVMRPVLVNKLLPPTEVIVGRLPGKEPLTPRL